MCGIFGIYAPERDVARLTYFGLFALQHRGQESAGIAVSDDGQPDGAPRHGPRRPGVLRGEAARARRPGGDRPHALLDDRLHACGRTPSRASSTARRATVALGHNGNLTNTAELRDELVAAGCGSRSTSDTEVIAALIARRARAARGGGRGDDGASSTAPTRSSLLAEGSSSASATRTASARSRSAGSTATACSPPRPARSTCVGAELVREVEPGELVVDRRRRAALGAGRAPTDAGALCIFEFIYFARPDSRLAGVELHGARVRMGERLGRGGAGRRRRRHAGPRLRHAGRDRLRARERDPLRRGPGQEPLRRPHVHPARPGGCASTGIRLKFNPLAEVAGQARRRRRRLDRARHDHAQDRRDAVRGRAHARCTCASRRRPIVSPCFYGIDMATEGELIAAGRSVEEIREQLGATSLAYLSLEGLQEATSAGPRASSAAPA